MVQTLGMCEFGPREDATSKAGKALTTTKWIDRAKKNDAGRELVTCVFFAAMPPLEAKQALFAYVAGVREKRREHGQDEMKLMFVDVRKAHSNAKCDV